MRRTKNQIISNETSTTSRTAVYGGIFACRECDAPVRLQPLTPLPEHRSRDWVMVDAAFGNPVHWLSCPATLSDRQAAARRPTGGYRIRAHLAALVERLGGADPADDVPGQLNAAAKPTPS